MAILLDGPKEYVVIAGVPQVSVLGTLLGIVVVNRVLGLLLKHSGDVEQSRGETLYAIKSRLRMVELDLANYKHK